MTEIPEHLLKRSRERRQAAGLPTEGGAQSGEAPTAPAAPAAAPAKKAAATPAKPAGPVAPPPPKPDPPYIAAAKRRRKTPFWAMTALGLLPLWGFLYVRGLTPESKAVEGPMGVGAGIYAGSCASCHGADGGGGAGRPLSKGEVVKTFPHIEDQLNFVYNGTQGYLLAGMTTFGDPNREGGAQELGWGRGAAMPAQSGALTEAQILAVVCDERFGVGGADPQGELADEFTKWCAPDAENWLGLSGGTMTFDTIDGLGTAPRPASSK